jgi:hypothetical protein
MGSWQSWWASRSAAPQCSTAGHGPRRGYADVFKRGCFAWQNKAPGKPLDAALRQLMGYALALNGGLFARIEVPPLSPLDVAALRDAAALD